MSAIRISNNEDSMHCACVYIRSQGMHQLEAKELIN